MVAIGQSLGGAVATLLARDFPDDVAGLVLLEASPVNDVRFARLTERSIRSQARLDRLPVLGTLIGAAMRKATTRMVRKRDLSPDAEAAMEKVMTADVQRTKDAAAGLAASAESFDQVALPIVPAAVVTADRKDTHPVRQAHARLADALHAPLLQWPTAIHPVHLTHTDEVIAACREVLARAT